MKKLIPLVGLLLLLALGVLLVYTLRKETVAPEDSSALFGGVSEFGYPSAGYVVTETDASLKTCGYAVISSTKAVTAAHCVDEATAMYLGKGTYTSTRSDELPVSKAIQKEGWVRSQDRNEDFALLVFEGDQFFSSFATVAEPTVGCDYKVVAYGRTELPDDPPMLRKSARLCITDITSKTFRVKGNGDSGICFGDSGSPIYKADTNKLVGFVASIVSEDDKNINPCSFDNVAIAVRVDANTSLINDENSEISDTSDVIVSKEFSIEVADESVSERLGLDQVSKQDLLKIAFGGTIAGVVVVSVILIRDLAISMKNERKMRDKAGIF